MDPPCQLVFVHVWVHFTELVFHLYNASETRPSTYAAGVGFSSKVN